MRQLFRTSWFLKCSMYASELIWVNLYLWIFFRQRITDLAPINAAGGNSYAWIAILLSFCYLCGSYVSPITFYYRTTRAGSIVRNVFFAQTASMSLFLVILLVVHCAGPFQSWRTLLLWATICLTLIFWRLVAKSTMRYLRSRGFNVHYVVLVGNSSNIIELYNEMRDPCHGYRLLGYFYDTPVADFPSAMYYLGTISDIIPYMRTRRVDQLYCSLPSSREEDIVPLLSYCERHCIRFFSVPNVRNYLKRQMSMELFGRVPLLYIREDPLSQTDNRIIKRAFDIVVSGLFMIPFWLLIYPIVGLIIKLTSPGPVFFKQQRNGLNGRIFYCYKFRSMRVNAAADQLQATAHDPRKTRFGDFLRHTSIDELPQFINVLQGHMSVVGPRPHMVKHTEEYSAIIDKYMVRHWVKPGITGWAQVNGARGETQRREQMEDRIAKDIWYIENWTLWLDIRIMFLTVWNGIRGDKQAY
jgi:putative colanic acid biosynthesis UDP-glucose lipid carrier transferase